MPDKVFIVPPPDYNQDGGFIGRSNEINDIKNELYFGRAPVVTISGPGGIGKTAIAQCVCEKIVQDSHNPFSGIFWFSAKRNRLTEKGIESTIPDFIDSETLLKEIFLRVKKISGEDFTQGSDKKYSISEKLNFYLAQNKILIIIDNLETIIQKPDIVSFVKNIPAPSKVLITSRFPLGEIEKRFEIKFMDSEEACDLFKTVTTARGLNSLSNLNNNEIIKKYLKPTNKIPLLIKWTIGKLCLGEKSDEITIEIKKGDGDIAKFMFEDLYALLSEDEKKILFCLNFLGGIFSVRGRTIRYFSGVHEDVFDPAITRLIQASLIFETDEKRGLGKYYRMLDLTQNFVTEKFNRSMDIKNEIENRYRKDFERRQNLPERIRHIYFNTQIIDIPEDITVFELLEEAKICIQNTEYDTAESLFSKAVLVNPENIELLINYSSFLFDVKKNPNACSYAERAMKLDGQNPYAMYNYGKILSGIDNSKEQALEILIKAKKNCPLKESGIRKIIYKIAEIYSDLEKYSEAIIEISNFIDNIDPQKKIKGLELYEKRAEIYLNWGKKIDNFVEKKSKLKLALDDSKYVLIIKDLDFGVYTICRDIFLEYGKIICENEGLEKGQLCFDKCLESFNIKDNKIIPNNDQLYYANYWRVFYSIKEGKNFDYLKGWFLDGLHFSNNDQKSIKLQELVSKKGIIEKINKEKSFGIIKENETQDTFLFWYHDFIFPSGRKLSITLDEITNAKTKGFLILFKTEYTQGHKQPKASELIIVNDFISMKDFPENQ